MPAEDESVLVAEQAEKFFAPGAFLVCGENMPGGTRAIRNYGRMDDGEEVIRRAFRRDGFEPIETRRRIVGVEESKLRVAALDGVTRVFQFGRSGIQGAHLLGEKRMEDMGECSGRARSRDVVIPFGEDPWHAEVRAAHEVERLRILPHG